MEYTEHRPPTPVRAHCKTWLTPEALAETYMLVRGRMSVWERGWLTTREIFLCAAWVG